MEEENTRILVMHNCSDKSEDDSLIFGTNPPKKINGTSIRSKNYMAHSIDVDMKVKKGEKEYAF